MFFYLPKCLILLSVTAVLLGLGIHKYQDQIQELSSQVTQPIKEAFGVLGLHLGEAKDKILVFLDDLKEKVMSLPSTFSSTADDQDTEASTLDKILVFLDDLKEKVKALKPSDTVSLNLAMVKISDNLISLYGYTYRNWKYSI